MNLGSGSIYIKFAACRQIVTKFCWRFADGTFQKYALINYP